MNRYRVFAWPAGIAIIGCFLFLFIQKAPAKKSAAGGFAVIELFTSEGCSSCPPADALLAKIKTEMSDSPVYVLAYHVDYWDQLGWKDPYSSAAYTKRQNEYAGRLRLQSIYTPQIVVNGQTEFVGSNESRLRQVIKEGLSKTATSFTLRIKSADLKQVVIDYSVPATDATEVYIACVQKVVQMKVERGENRGHTLAHVNVVQSLNRLPAGKDRMASILLPAGYNSRDWELIGFVQNRKTGEITAAASASNIPGNNKSN